MSMKETKAFVQAALRNPKQVSTIFRSSKYLAQSLIDAAEIQNNPRILEIGCGTGAITKQIQKNMKENLKKDSNLNFDYLGIEIDPGLVDYLNESFKDMKFHAGSAAELKTIVADNSVDCVISSLPWTMFTPSVRQDILSEVLRVLKPNGTFTTFICTNTFVLPTPYKLKKFFAKNLNQFERFDFITKNIPPAIVYRGKKS